MIFRFGLCKKHWQSLHIFLYIPVFFLLRLHNFPAKCFIYSRLLFVRKVIFTFSILIKFQTDALYVTSSASNVSIFCSDIKWIIKKYNIILFKLYLSSTYVHTFLCRHIIFLELLGERRWFFGDGSYEDEDSTAALWRPRYKALSVLTKRAMSGIVEECCRKACSRTELIGYCRRRH